MSVIALHGVPQTWKKKAVNNNLKPLLGKNIAVLQFAEGPKNSPTKICFIEIPADMDIKLAIAKINTHKFNGKKKMYAVVPVYNELPQTLPTSSNIEKMEKSANLLPSTILAGAHEQILIEMQSKFTGLHSLSLRTGHKLMNEIAEIICQRLNDIGKDGQSMTGFQLTEAYRKRHPHFGDFQLIVSTLHALQDKARVPRTHIEEPALVKAKANVQPYSLENISLTKITQTCDKYSEKIVKTLDEHIKNLKETYNLQPTEENSGEIAKNNVRKALKSVRPYLPNIVRKLMAEYFVPNNAPFVRMRLYGEPGLPGAKFTNALLKRFGVVHVSRSDRMYNLLKFNVPPFLFDKLMETDGSVINGCTIVIRTSDMPQYNLPKPLKKKLYHDETVGSDDNIEPAPMDVQDDWAEEWNVEEGPA